MIKSFRSAQINQKFYVILLFLIVLARLSIAVSQRVFLMPNGAGIDDGLMFAAAQSIEAGNWLGAYGAFTLAKTMGFSLWLFLVHGSGVPYLLANALLWVLCSGFAVWALRPVAPGNVLRAALFALFAFLPTSFAFFTTRAYRDAVFSSFCLLLFAGVLALALRAKEEKMRGRFAAAIGTGIGLAGVFLLREDGLVLLPFALCGLGLLLLHMLKNDAVKHKKKLVLQCILPFLFLFVGVVSFSLANYMHYGVFMLSDNTQGAFPAAYGAIAAVAEAESDFERLVPVPNEALEKLMEEVPSLALLKPSLEEGAAYNGFYNREKDGYGGSFYYALRLAADLQGLTPTAQSAQNYWWQVQNEIEQAVAEGRLQSAQPSGGTLARWNAQMFWPVVQEFFASMRATLFFENIEARPILSEGTYEEALEMAVWLNTVPQEPVYEQGSETLYMNPLQTAVFFMCDGLIWLYRVLLWPLLFAALYQTGKNLWQGAKASLSGRRLSESLLLSLLCVGLLLSYLLRLFVAAYLEVAAFDIGTELMYLASGMPALLLFCLLGALQSKWPFEKERAV